MNDTNAKIDFYITAGGKARRMNGCVKAFVEVKGKRIIDANLEQIPSVVSNVGIITNEAYKFDEYKKKGFSIISDVYKDVGPLAGLHAALIHSDADAIIISASDMPNINKNIILRLISAFINGNNDVVVPIINEKVEPLFAIYSKNILNKLEDFITGGRTYAVRKFLKELDVHYLEFSGEEDLFVNINSEKDLIK